MLISHNIETANVWRIFASLGWCFFAALWIDFALSLKNSNPASSYFKVKVLIYTPAVIFFITNIIYEPSKVIMRQPYGFIDTYETTNPGTVFNIYFPILFIIGIIIIFLRGRDSKKNRVKKQTKIIMITCLISFSLGMITDIILPEMGIGIFPLAIIAASIAMAGIWYAINKHRMMYISPKYVSEYIYKAVNEPIFILGEDFVIKSFNDASLKITGYNYTELVEKPLATLINNINLSLNIIMEKGYVNNVEIDFQRKGKASIVCELTGTVIYDEYKDILGIVILLHDISHSKQIAQIQKEYTLKLEESNMILKNEIRNRLYAENQIRHFVYYDALTGLPNRKKMLEQFNILMESKNEKFAVLFIDLDNFKNVNDNFGHYVGDQILKAVADRLKESIRSSDTISRIGGDEFIILLRDLKSFVDAEKIAVAIGKVLEPAFIYNRSHLHIGSSIGISIFPEHGGDADTLIKNADLAMYEVKNNGGYGYSIYCSELKQKTNLKF